MFIKLQEIKHHLKIVKFFRKIMLVINLNVENVCMVVLVKLILIQILIYYVMLVYLIVIRMFFGVDFSKE